MTLERRYHVLASADSRELARWLNRLAAQPIPPGYAAHHSDRRLVIEGMSTSSVQGELGDTLVVTVICSRLEAEDE